MTLRVMVVDDHPVVRAGLSALLSAAPGIVVVAEAADAAAAVDAAADHAPDVVVMDLHLPDASGAEATRSIRERSPQVAVLILTMDEGTEAVRLALAAGATGYVLKGADPIEVVRAVEAVGRGELVVGSGIAGKVVNQIVAGPWVEDPRLASLSDRERQVLGLLGTGATNADIARRLGLQPKTARNHVSNILVKLGVADRREAALIELEARGR